MASLYWIEDALAGILPTLWMTVGLGLPWALALLSTERWRCRAMVAALALALGPAAMTAWMLILGVAGAQLDQPLLTMEWILAGSLVIAGGGGLIAWRKSRFFVPQAAQTTPLAVDEKLLIGMMMAAVILRWIHTAFWPFIAYDALWVYGFQGRLYFLEGMIPHAIDYYPQFVQLQYAWVQIAIGEINDHAARMVIPMMHIGSILAAYLLGKGLLNRRAGLLTAALWSLHPLVGQWAFVGDLETPLAFSFTLAAAFFLRAWLDEKAARRRQNALLAGMMLGIALFTKPTGGAFIWGILLMLAVELLRTGFRARARFTAVLWTLLACLPLGGVWYLRNLLLGHEMITFPPETWLSLARRSGDYLNWLALTVIVGFLIYSWRQVWVHFSLLAIKPHPHPKSLPHKEGGSLTGQNRSKDSPPPHKKGGTITDQNKAKDSPSPRKEGGTITGQNKAKDSPSPHKEGGTLTGQSKAKDSPSPRKESGTLTGQNKAKDSPSLHKESRTLTGQNKAKDSPSLLVGARGQGMGGSLLHFAVGMAGVMLLLAGVLASNASLFPERFDPPGSYIRLAEAVSIAVGLCLTGLAVRRAVNWRSSRAVGAVFWALLLAAPYFVTFFHAYSYHYRLGFAIVPLLALPTAIILAKGLPWERIQRGGKYALILILLLGLPGVASVTVDVNWSAVWLLDERLDSPMKKYQAFNPSLVEVVFGLEDYLAETGEQPIVLAPGEQRLPFFFPQMQIISKLARTLDDYEALGATHFVYGAKARAAYVQAGIDPAQTQLVAALGRQDLFNKIKSHYDGTFSYELHQSKNMARRHAPPSRSRFPTLHDTAEIVFGGILRLRAEGLHPPWIFKESPITLQTAWQALAPLQHDYRFVFELYNRDTDKVGQQWILPLGQHRHGDYATSLWDPGETVRDLSIVKIPEDSEITHGSNYVMRLRVLDPLGAWLPVEIDGQAAGDFLTLAGVFRVGPP